MSGFSAGFAGCFGVLVAMLAAVWLFVHVQAARDALGCVIGDCTPRRQQPVTRRVAEPEPTRAPYPTPRPLELFKPHPPATVGPVPQNPFATVGPVSGR
jgi:hypothetical protein